MTYKKAGVDVEKEERAIQIMMKDMNEDGRRRIVRFDVDQKQRKMSYQISYDHGDHGANELTDITTIDELKKVITELKDDGHNDIRVWAEITDELNLD